MACGRSSPILVALLIPLALLLGAAPLAAQTDLTLEEAVELALDHSYGVKSAAHDTAAMSSQRSAVRAAMFPTLALQAVAYRLDERQQISLPVGDFKIGSQENYLAELKLSVPLYTGGKIGNNIKIQEQNLLASNNLLDAQRLRVSYNCRRAYLSLLLSDYITAAAQSSVRRINLIATDVDNLYANGMADSLDLLEVALSRQKAFEQVDEADKIRADATVLLANLIGHPADEPRRLTDTVPLTDLAQESFFTGASSSINRPELEAASRRIDAAGYQARLLSAQRLPNLAGYLAYTGGKPNRDLFNQTWNDYLTLGAALTWEMNLANETGRKVAAARQHQSSLEMQRADLLDKFRLQVRTVINSGKLAFRKLVRAHDEYQLSQQKYRLAQEKQRAGDMTVNRLLELEAELTQTEQLFQAARVNYQLAIADYLYAVGSHDIYGGF